MSIKLRRKSFLQKWNAETNGGLKWKERGPPAFKGRGGKHF
ncbi:hypothetical protein Cabys_1415 [Caldithrix abyssi DSM 13497]|uniref:Uncharacterized protein n=1 Tax=Caldithrix abyssi DSM 13497 TaxID=880073 RepID=A0A1J1C6Z6_CALAY|nr:hypothetical protein Cabys_1415 [Caldithrix abyssi DSM 13497]